MKRDKCEGLKVNVKKQSKKRAKNKLLLEAPVIGDQRSLITIVLSAQCSVLGVQCTEISDYEDSNIIVEFLRINVCGLNG